MPCQTAKGNSFVHKEICDKFLCSLNMYHFNHFVNLIHFLQSAVELIREIATLELEVVHLEQYLLSLYRKAFDGQSSTVSTSAKDENSKLPSTPRGRAMEAPLPSAFPSAFQSLENPRKDYSDIGRDEKLLVSNYHRSQSSLTTVNAASLDEVSTSVESLDRTLRACHSQPVSMMEVSFST